MMAVELHPWQPANALGLAVSVQVDDGTNTYYVSGFEMAALDISRDAFIDLVNVELKSDNKQYRHMQLMSGSFRAVQDPGWLPSQA